MDSLRGNFDAPDFTEASNDFDLGEDDNGQDLPPAAIGQDERRMQVRAYNHWASMLGERNFPSIEELDPENLPDFGPYSVLLDFSTGIEDPAIQYLGDELAAECGTQGHIARLSDVPSRSLLSRITDHYLQILANQAPIGFEAEFVNQRGATILYRGILLPFSSDNDTIDFIYGVINWKEVADQAEADELLLEIDQALEAEEDEPVKRASDPVTDWADRPSADSESDDADAPSASGEAEPEGEVPESGYGKISDIGGFGLSPIGEENAGDDELPEPDFAQYALDDDDFDEEEGEDEANYDFASLTDHIAAPAKKAISLDFDEEEGEDADGEGAADSAPAPSDPLAAPDTGPQTHDATEDAAREEASFPIPQAYEGAPHESGEEGRETGAPAPGEAPLPAMQISAQLPEDAGLYDYLALAREAAQTASECEDRSRRALYQAIGQAYDFSIAAREAPGDYAELLADCGLTAQQRAPMTPIVKLVFGVDYDKTRLTEYAAALSLAHRVGIARGGLAEYLEQTSGGLKAVVNAERRWRREQAGKDVEPEGEVRSALASKLRKLAPQDFTEIAREGSEFGLVVIRRTEEGEVVVLGEIDEDIALIERAARKLIG